LLHPPRRSREVLHRRITLATRFYLMNEVIIHDVFKGKAAHITRVEMLSSICTKLYSIYQETWRAAVNAP
jgi:hypothetical protein